MPPFVPDAWPFGDATGLAVAAAGLAEAGFTGSNVAPWDAPNIPLGLGNVFQL
jgi:hypothetical protein